ncbi:MAG: ABC transporter ATP-binding protein [Alphaproteobacteria bacterium]|nr:ABC transporter ATP-binding protein [Alphaproteobacteria bacterium]
MTTKQGATVGRVLVYLAPYRRRVILALALVLAMTGFELLKPWPLKIIVDHVLGDRPAPAWLIALGDQSAWFLGAVLAVVAVQIVLSVIALAHNHITIAIGHDMINDLRAALYAHLQRLSLMFHSRRQVGDLMYRVTADTFAVQSLLMNGLLTMVTSGLLLIGMFVIMVQIDWLLAVVAMVVCPPLLLVIVLLNRFIIAAATEMKEKESAVYSLATWSIAAIRVVQAFTKERDEHSRFMAASRSSLKTTLRLYNLQTLYGGMVSVVIATGTALIVWLGVRSVMGGTMTLGELLVFIAYLAALYQPIDTLSRTWGSLQGARVGVRRVFEILDVEADVKDGTREFPPTGARGHVIWRQAAFRYNPSVPVLAGVDLEVMPGECIAVVGPTGAGKSTMLSLIPRFFDPVEGSVQIDGHDAREYRVAALRQQISMVLQPPLIFPLSVRDNIAYGRPSASDEHVIEAARLARIHDRIVAMPQGYDTAIGEGFAALSEGEKQRVTIARAILRDAPILILDEPTSALDAETEAMVMDGLARLMKGRTSFVIAHRLSTVRNANRVVVLDQGKIIESGPFAELIARGGAFAHLYHTQFKPLAEAKTA